MTSEQYFRSESPKITRDIIIRYSHLWDRKEPPKSVELKQVEEVKSEKEASPIKDESPQPCSGDTLQNLAQSPDLVNANLDELVWQHYKHLTCESKCAQSIHP